MARRERAIGLMYNSAATSRTYQFRRWCRDVVAFYEFMSDLRSRVAARPFEAVGPDSQSSADERAGSSPQCAAECAGSNRDSDVICDMCCRDVGAWTMASGEVLCNQCAYQQGHADQSGDESDVPCENCGAPGAGEMDWAEYLCSDCAEAQLPDRC